MLEQAVWETAKLTFDFLTLKVVSESRVMWATSVPILVFLGNFSLTRSVLDLGPMYATDRQTSDAHHRLLPQPPTWRGIISKQGAGNAEYTVIDKSTAAVAIAEFQLYSSTYATDCFRYGTTSGIDVACREDGDEDCHERRQSRRHFDDPLSSGTAQIVNSAR